MSQLTCVGYVGKDPQQNNGSVAFSIAETEKWVDKSGQKQEHVEWTNCVVFGKLGGVVMQYVHKGSFLVVFGKKRTNSYTDNKQVDRQSVQCIVDKIIFGPKTGDSQHQQQYEPKQEEQSQQAAASQHEPHIPEYNTKSPVSNSFDPLADDDIPF